MLTTKLRPPQTKKIITNAMLERYNQNIFEQVSGAIKKRKLRKNFVIVAVGKGGFNPAVRLAHLFDDALSVYAVVCKYYDPVTHRRSEEPQITQPVPAEAVKGKNILVIDDLTDSGNTLRKIREHLLALGAKKVHFAVLLHKEGQSVFTPHYFARKITAKEIKQDIWFEFPWEKKKNKQKV